MAPAPKPGGGGGRLRLGIGENRPRGCGRGTKWRMQQRVLHAKLLKYRRIFRRGELGGAEGIRTPDLCSAIAALSHLSYSPGRFIDQAAKIRNSRHTNPLRELD